MKKGFVLITTLAVLIIIALGTVVVLRSMGSVINVKTVSLQEARDQYLTEAGMQYALSVCAAHNGDCAAIAGIAVGARPAELQGVSIRTEPTTSNTPPYRIVVCVPTPGDPCP